VPGPGMMGAGPMGQMIMQPDVGMGQMGPPQQQQMLMQQQMMMAGGGQGMMQAPQQQLMRPGMQQMRQQLGQPQAGRGGVWQQQQGQPWRGGRGRGGGRQPGASPDSNLLGGLAE